MTTATKASPSVTTIRFVSPDPQTFGFEDVSGSPIPSFPRNGPISLAVAPSVWHRVESVTLTEFRALTGPPWVDFPESWAGLTLTLTQAGQAPDPFVLRTSYSNGHRLVKFRVTVRLKDERKFTYIDPWDEAPGARGT